MLTERRKPRTADEQPSGGWDETRFWVGTFGVFVTVFVLSLVVMTFVLSVAFGYRPVAVVSGSMEPGISVGDVVLYERQGLSGIEEGRIIVFDDPTIEGGTIIHRVVDTDPDTGWLRTKGDANNSNDSGWVTEDDIKGVGRVLIPFVGIPAAWVQTGRPIAAIAVVAFILFAAWTARWGWHRRYDPWAQIVASNAGGHDAAHATAMTISGIELLAAALLKIGAPLRLRTQVGRRRGTVSVLSLSQEVEALLHRTADPAALDDVDAVLRHMAAGLATTKPAPVIVGLARVRLERRLNEMTRALDVRLGLDPVEPAPEAPGGAA